MARAKDISLPVTEKRGRGRPPKADALTNAQRQAAFRERQKAAGKPVTVTKKEHDEVVLECKRLRKELAQARAQARAVDGQSRRMAGEGRSHVAASTVLTQPVPADTNELDEKRLAVTVAGREFFSLERLAAHHRLPKRAVLERLLWWADNSVVRSFGDDVTAFNRYVDIVTKKR